VKNSVAKSRAKPQTTQVATRTKLIRDGASKALAKQAVTCKKLCNQKRWKRT